jgi:murein L,D-transpeptidase YcbB/YkuD
MPKALIYLLFCLFCAQSHALSPTGENIRQFCELIQEGTASSIALNPVAAVQLLTDFYGRREFQPVWEDAAHLQALLAVLGSAGEHGLDPEDYHYGTLQSLVAQGRDARLQAELDILASDALIRYGYHLYFGKVDPATLDPDWNLERDLRGQETVAVLEAALSAPSLATFLNEKLAPNGPFYSGLKRALAQYRALARTGGWPVVPDGPSLKSGDLDQRVTALRARLAVSDAAGLEPVADPLLFDELLEAAVKRFQDQHGLAVDGIIGQRTLRALNVPVEDRIDQLRVNLERTRWVFHGLESRYLIVNIAGFHAYLMDNGKRIWDSRVVVGTRYRKTPVFRAKLSYLVFNPTWTVPPGILRKDIIPALHRDPAYLSSHNMVLLDASGQIVDPGSIDLLNLTAEDLPYIVRQEPGPDNALGRIKFMFPNQHLVYLHDTPARSLFERADRTFSSGCIRVEHPLTLAEILLDDPVVWNRANIERRMAAGRTETVNLRTPITVLLMYWTAETDFDGRVKLLNDVYGRDAAVLRGLAEPVHLIPQR